MKDRSEARFFFGLLCALVLAALLIGRQYDALKLLAWAGAGVLFSALVVLLLPGVRYGRPLVMVRAVPVPDGKPRSGPVLIPLSQRWALLTEGILVVSLWPEEGACEVHVQAGWARVWPVLVVLMAAPAAQVGWSVSGGGWRGALVAEAAAVNALALVVVLLAWARHRRAHASETLPQGQVQVW